MPKVLHVDDDESIRELMLLACSFADDIDLDQASDGPEALSMAISNRPDLILLDYMMPDMSGREVIRHLKADCALRDIPVVFMTARTIEDELAGMRELGAIDVWTKPFDPFSLAEAIRSQAKARALV